VNHERLWAPWRLQYVTGNESEESAPPEPQRWVDGADHHCFLCRAAAEYEDPACADRELFVPQRGEYSLVVLNRYPYNNGHLLIAPNRHVADLCAMNRDEHLECMQQLGRITAIYRQQLNAEGFNIGLNLGRVAGAGLPGHLHWHLVPRWAGDNNFMPVLAGTRVIPQSLEELWMFLSAAVNKAG
jgi:ATP adenylyltransferase